MRYKIGIFPLIELKLCFVENVNSYSICNILRVKPKNGELTQDQMEANPIITSFRIHNTLSIDGMKRGRIMKDTIRIHASQNCVT